MKKQIEELKFIIEKWCMDFRTDLSLEESLYKAGYRKQSEDGLMLTFDGATGYFPKEFIIDAIKAYQKQSEGEWKKSDKNGISINGYMVCSVCNVMIPNCDFNRYCLGRLDFCPRCGARMKGE